MRALGGDKRRASSSSALTFSAHITGFLFNSRRVLGISSLLECIGLFLLAFSSFFVRSTASEAGGGGGARETGGRSS